MPSKTRKPYEVAMTHIRKYGKNRKLTECGTPASKGDVWSTAWLKPFPKCPECMEAIRVRMAAYLA